MKQLSLYRALLKRVFSFSSTLPIASLILLVCTSFLQGIGVMMLIPFLELAGVSTGGELSPVAEKIETLFIYLNLSFNLITVLGLYIGLISLKAGLNYLKSIYDSRLTQDFTQYLRNNVHKAFSQADWSLITQKGASEIGNLFVTEIQRVGQAIQQSLRLAGTLVIALAYFAVSVLLSIPMSVLALISIGILFLLQQPLNRIVHNTGKRAHNLFRSFYKSISEHITGFKDVKILGDETSYHQHFAEITTSMRNTHHRFGVARAQSRLMLEIMSVVLIAVYFYVSLNLYRIPLSELLVLLYIFARLTPLIRSLLGKYQNILNVLPAFKSIQKFYNECERFKESGGKNFSAHPKAWSPITFKNVSYSYPSHDELVLDNLSLTIQPFQLSLIYGPSGGGKSTVADLLLRLISPTSGMILIEGINLENINRISWRAGVGYVQQSPFLFNSSIRENLERANPEATKTEIRRSLELACAYKFISELPEGIETRIGSKGTRFSGGELQRIALARALVRDPRLLILDEATSALDPETEKEVINNLNQLISKMTIVLISHDEKVRQYADHIFEMRKGKIYSFSEA